MTKETKALKTVRKEMGITHNDFFELLHALLDDTPYQQNLDTITFQLNHKRIEIVLGPEGVRKLGQSMRVPTTSVTLNFFDFTDEEVSAFIKHFNLKFMKGGG